MPAVPRPAGPDGLLVVDKPSGLTSHDVVARVRKLAGTRKVGHAGTLDPMATGVLVLGLGRATRLLGHLAARDKTYLATARLGATTVTDDADGEVLTTTPAGHLDAATVRAAAAAFVGTLDQVPSAVSAIKVDGRRSYARVRAGEDVELASRTVTVTELVVDDVRHVDDFVDLDLTVTCSSGTYVRAIARDLGEALGVGGHLTMLRRTRVGTFTLDGALPPTALSVAASAMAHPAPDESAGGEVAPELPIVPLEIAVARAFPRIDVDADTAVVVGHTGRAPLPEGAVVPEGPVGVFGPDGLVALMERQGERLRSLVVFAPAAT